MASSEVLPQIELLEALEASLLHSSLCVRLTEIPPTRMCTVGVRLAEDFVTDCSHLFPCCNILRCCTISQDILRAQHKAFRMTNPELNYVYVDNEVPLILSVLGELVFFGRALSRFCNFC